MAEQLAHGGWIELVQPLEFAGMNAADHEQAVDPERLRAGKVGPHAIADRQHAVQRRRLAARCGGQRHRAIVDRTMRLAVEDHLAAEFAIQFGDRAGAIDQPVAALDHDIGIGADERQVARARLHHHRAVIFRAFGLVVERAGADDVVGAFQRREFGVEPAIDRIVALRPEPEHRLAVMAGNEIPRQIAGRDDGVVGVVGNAKLAQLPLHRVGRTRRVGDHHDGAAAVAERHAARRRRRETIPARYG